MRKPYPTDLSYAQCNYIEPHMPAHKGHGRPRTHSLREILNAVFYILKSGCQWRLLPHDFPREMDHPLPLLQSLAYRRGTWERINRAIGKPLRVRLNRDPQPSAGVVDCHSVKRAPRGGRRRSRL
jgi:putative transposase